MLRREDIGNKLWAELQKASPYVAFCLEVYPAHTIDFVSIDAAKNSAIGHFSDTALCWNGIEYRPQILSWGIELTRILGAEFNSADITFSNVAKGTHSFIAWLEQNRIKNKRVVVRLIAPEIEDESLICWWGKADKPGEGNEKQISNSLFEEGGNLEAEIPFRNFSGVCPLDFAKGDCLGHQTLEQKTLAYQQAAAEYEAVNRSGPRPCGGTHEGCARVGNTDLFQGQRLVAVSGVFTYQQTITKRSWKTLWRKVKKTVTLSDNFSSQELTDQDASIPVIFGGLVQSQLLPIQWADKGQFIEATYAISEGLIESATEIKCRTAPFQIAQPPTVHLGDFGNVGTQTPSPFFPQSGVKSRLACADIRFSGSDPQVNDDAPDVTGVFKGYVIREYDSQGNLIHKWSNNPIWNEFFAETSEKFGRLKPEWYDWEDLRREAAHCNELVEDTSGAERIFLPQNEYPNYNPNNNYSSSFFRRFHSGSIYTSLAYRLETGDLQLPFPYEFIEPNVVWFDDLLIPQTLPSVTYLRKRYALGLLIQEKSPLREVIQNQMFITHKGYREMSHQGKIRLRSRKKADNTFVRENIKASTIYLPVQNVRAWLLNRDGYVIIGVGEENVEARKVTSIEYSDVANNLQLDYEYQGNLTISGDAMFSGGSQSTPAIATITIEGTPSQFSSITLKVGEDENQVTINYVASQDDTLESVAFMLQAHINANQPLRQILRAEQGLEPNQIRLIAYVGNLVLDRPLDTEHFADEEVLRVQEVYENCQDSLMPSAVGNDNINAGSFRFNLDKQKDVNTVRANFTNVVDDFALTPLQPRINHLDREESGQKNLDVDLRGIGNAWQAGFILKGLAIRAIDGNFHCSWDTKLIGVLHEFADVVAVNVSEGGRILRLMPIELNEINLSPDSRRVRLSGQLYLSSEFDERVEVFPSQLPTTLSPANQTSTPSPTGSFGIGLGGTATSEGGIVNASGGSGNYGQGLLLERYSPDGRDVV